MFEVLSRPEFSRRVSATRRNDSFAQPHTRSTISGVYREKCRFTTWSTQRGFFIDGSVFGRPGTLRSSTSERVSGFPAGGAGGGFLWYAQLAVSYFFPSGDSPEKTPPSSSVSL